LKGIVIKQNENLSNEACHLINSMLKLSEDERISVIDAIDHCWIKGISMEIESNPSRNKIGKSIDKKSKSSQALYLVSVKNDKILPPISKSPIGMRESCDSLHMTLLKKYNGRIPEYLKPKQPSQFNIGSDSDLNILFTPRRGSLDKKYVREDKKTYSVKHDKNVLKKLNIYRITNSDIVTPKHNPEIVVNGRMRK
jgi:hypothetical protein